MLDLYVFKNLLELNLFITLSITMIIAQYYINGLVQENITPVH